MEIYSNTRKKFKNLIFTNEFDQTYTNSTTKTVFIIYCLCGGFCFDEKVQKNFRKFWINYNILNFIMVYSSCIFYLTNAPIKDYYSLLLPAPVMGGLLVQIGTYFWIYTARDTFSKLFAFLDRKNLTLGEQSLQSATPESIRTESKKTENLITIILLTSCCLLLIGSAQNFEKYVKFDDYIIVYYPFYTPFDKTALIRWIIRVIQFVSLWPLNMFCTATPALFFATTHRIRDKFVILSDFIRDASESLSRSIDEIWRLETAMEDKYMPSSLSRIQEMKIKKALATDEFVEKMVIGIKQHQELHSMATIYANKLNFIFSLIYVQVLQISIVRAFFISSITEPKQVYQSLPVFMVFCGLLLIWLLLCFVGDMFQNMNEMMALEIYNSPWYHLEPQDRRLIHTFMTIIQRPIELVVCELYPLNLFLYPDLLDTIYSQVQILRTLQLNRQKRHG